MPLLNITGLSASGTVAVNQYAGLAHKLGRVSRNFAKFFSAKAHIRFHETDGNNCDQPSVLFVDTPVGSNNFILCYKSARPMGGQLKDQHH